MEIKLDHLYKDRAGVVWKIIEINEAGKHPVTGARWEGRGYRTRTYLRDGSYLPKSEDRWDLVEEVTRESA